MPNEHASLDHDAPGVAHARRLLMPQMENQDEIVAVLNRLLEAELAGVVRYTHYSFLVFGFSRIPVVSWLRRAGQRIAAPRRAGGRMDHRAGRLPLVGNRVAARLAPARHIGDPEGVIGDGRRGAEALTPTAPTGRGPIGRSRRIRAPDDLHRRIARRRGGQDAAPPRRGCDTLESQRLTEGRARRLCRLRENQFHRAAQRPETAGA